VIRLFNRQFTKVHSAQFTDPVRNSIEIIYKKTKWLYMLELCKNYIKYKLILFFKMA
jgi:hypothetical protein